MKQAYITSVLTVWAAERNLNLLKKGKAAHGLAAVQFNRMYLQNKQVQPIQQHEPEELRFKRPNIHIVNNYTNSCLFSYDSRSYVQIAAIDPAGKSSAEGRAFAEVPCCAYKYIAHLQIHSALANT